MYTIITVK